MSVVVSMPTRIEIMVHYHHPVFLGKPIAGGLSGAYILSSLSTPGAEWIFKPRTQEARSPQGQALKSGAVLGTSCFKEAAAFVVDHGGFAGVPETITQVVEMQLGKNHLTDFGSLQRFIPHIGSCDEFGSSLFTADNIHHIALLDLRIGNCDRHEGNLLVAESPTGLRAVPIDHGYCLPSWRQLGDLYFCWASWRQSKAPFSSATKQYVAAQQPLVDVVDLLDVGVDHDSAMTYVLCSLFVQRAVAADLTLSQIAKVMQRGDEESSSFERVVDEAAKMSGFEGFSFADPMDWALPIVREFLKQFTLRSLSFLSAI